MLQNALVMIFYPTEGFNRIKKNTRIVEAFILFFLVCAVRMVQIFLTHFPLNSTPAWDTNLLIEVVKLLLPLFTWVLASYALTTIRDGESKISEVLVGTAYSMIPYIILVIPVSAISHFMSANDAGLYTFLFNAMNVWIAALFYLQVRDLNNYTFFETVKVIAMALFGMAMMWTIGGLFYILTLNIINFVKVILFEIKIISLG